MVAPLPAILYIYVNLPYVSEVKRM